jgi:hypothetical protein
VNVGRNAGQEQAAGEAKDEIAAKLVLHLVLSGCMPVDFHECVTPRSTTSSQRHPEPGDGPPRRGDTAGLRGKLASHARTGATGKVVKAKRIREIGRIRRRGLC